jgi:hypothetical protein
LPQSQPDYKLVLSSYYEKISGITPTRLIGGISRWLFY